jgi:homopolymeric O-antigen transport system ATP-binding protein
MSSEPVALRVERLGKRYRLGEPAPGIATFRETLVDAVQTPFRRRRQRRRDDDSIWALRDVSFEAARGEVIGIIGRNGAGKSTLLKILSRITEPTEGKAYLYGRVGSLLEIGTGFHTELTGRENIFLSGAILGMRRSEIAGRFAEIVDFSEVGRFIDTPVKHYSSGMYLRLAFAVAAHLEPEILIVDEVLAVGDVEFQKKCLGKMQDVARGEGRTVLFVSHNMDAVQRLCSRCLLLEGGTLIAQGDCPAVIGRYLAASMRGRPGQWIDLSQAGRMGTGEVRVVAVRYDSGLAELDGHARSDAPLDVSLALNSDAPRTLGSVAVTIYSVSGMKLVNADSIELGRVIHIARGESIVRLRIEELHLNPGVYRLGVWLADPLRGQRSRTAFDYVETAFEFEVVGGVAQGFGITPESAVTCRFDVIEDTPASARYPVRDVGAIT